MDAAVCPASPPAPVVAIDGSTAAADFFWPLGGDKSSSLAKLVENWRLVVDFFAVLVVVLVAFEACGLDWVFKAVFALD